MMPSRSLMNRLDRLEARSPSGFDAVFVQVGVPEDFPRQRSILLEDQTPGVKEAVRRAVPPDVLLKPMWIELAPGAAEIAVNWTPSLAHEDALPHLS